MPKHSHRYYDTYRVGNAGQRGTGGWNGLYNLDYHSDTEETGGNQPHKQYSSPHRIIKYIEFIGFN